MPTLDPSIRRAKHDTDFTGTSNFAVVCADQCSRRELYMYMCTDPFRAARRALCAMSHQRPPYIAGSPLKGNILPVTNVCTLLQASRVLDPRSKCLQVAIKEHRRAAGTVFRWCAGPPIIGCM